MTDDQTMIRRNNNNNNTRRVAVVYNDSRYWFEVYNTRHCENRDRLEQLFTTRPVKVLFGFFFRYPYTVLRTYTYIRRLLLFLIF